MMNIYNSDNHLQFMHLNLSYSSPYLYYPQVALHLISYRIKFLCIIFYIIALPMSSTSSIVICTIVLVLLLHFLSGFRGIQQIFPWLMQHILFVISVCINNLTSFQKFYILYITFQKSLYNLFVCSVELSHILYGYQVLQFKLIGNSFCIIFCMPTLLIRSYIIFSSYFLLYRICMLTTKQQDILLHYLKYFYRQSSKILQDLVLISILGFELLQIYEYRIKQIRQSLHWRSPDILSLLSQELICKVYLYIQIAYIHILLLIRDLSYRREAIFLKIDILLESSSCLGLLAEVKCSFVRSK